MFEQAVKYIENIERGTKPEHTLIPVKGNLEITNTKADRNFQLRWELSEVRTLSILPYNSVL